MDNADLTAQGRYRALVSFVLLGLTIVGVLAAAPGSADAATLKTFLISPTSIDFGYVAVGTTSAQQTVTITNVSNAAVLMSGVGGGAGVFGGVQNCQGATLNPGQSCQMFFAFTPAVLGAVTGASIGTWNGQGFNIAFTGVGTRRLLISPTSLDFGNVAVGTTSPQQTVTITNASSTPIVMSGAGGGPANPQFGGFQSCQGSTLNAGQSCTMTFFFTPAAIGPSTSASIGTWNGQDFNIALTGNGYKSTFGDIADADGRADLTVYRPSTGQWWILKSSSNYTTSTTIPFGNNTDKPVPGDYDGDGKTDLAVFRPSTGQWLVLTSSSNFVTQTTTSWGNSADIPVPGDYDGDGKTDLAVFRPSNGTWFIIKSSTGTPIGVQWGNSADIPVPGDYDGDGKTDVAIFRPSDGTWYIVKSSTGTAIGIQWGNSADLTAQGDYDGDGKTDVAIFRPSNGTWFILKSSTGTPVGMQWGNGADIAVPADYDGDGKTDIAVYRPSSGTWFIVNSSNGSQIGLMWGVATDIPIPETYLGRWVP